MIHTLVCSECGAAPNGMKLCHDMFDDLLGLKYQGDGEAYRLAIACYNFQHPKTHSAASWVFARDYLAFLIEQNCSVAKAREKAQIHFDSLTKEQLVVPIWFLDGSFEWEMTIRDFRETLFDGPMNAAFAWARSSFLAYRVFSTIS